MYLESSHRARPITAAEILAFITTKDRDACEPMDSHVMDYRGPDERGIVTIFTAVTREDELCLELGGIVRLADGRIADDDRARRDRAGAWHPIG